VSDHRSLSGAFDQAERRANAESKGGANPWSEFYHTSLTKKKRLFLEEYLFE
jgi:hypothetical protein